MKLIDKIKKNSPSYGGLPFWSWNDKLENEELIRQIQNMKDIGLNGFFMHARGGLMTEYCSDEWYDRIRTCVNEAKKLNMEAWAYDENGWPSGFAGGKLLTDKKNHVAFLNHTIGAFDKSAFAVYSIKDRPILISEPDGSKEYLNIYREYSSSYVDVMDESIIKKFIENTHEEYKKRIGDDFGKSMPGFFTDEPQYYRYATAWSDTFLDLFEKEYGYSVFDAIPALFIDFEGAKEVRYDYWYLCHKQYTNSFAKQIYDWCEENGAHLTGHSIEETSLSFQMVCCGGVMPFYEYEHIPGIDFLTRGVRNDLAPKQIGSVAAQLNKKKVLTETFALCGWDVSPIELKRIAQWQFVSGVNLICSHLYPYSERGERKYDYPAHYSDHLPWNTYYKYFNDYFANIGAAMSEGKEEANVLILHPMHSLYLYFQRIRSDESVAHLERPFHALLDKYGEHCVQYHLGDESIIYRHGKVEGNKFIIGSCSYEYVVIPESETIDLTTAELLKEFIKNGGKIVSEGALPTRIDGKTADISWLKPNADFNDILSARQAYIEKDGKPIANMRMNVRLTDEGRIFYITNLTQNEIYNAVLTVKNCNGLKQIHMLDLKEDAVNISKFDDDIKVSLDFTDSGSYFLVETNDPLPYIAPVSEKAFVLDTKDFIVQSEPENTLVLDYASLSYDGISYEPVRYVKHIHELLLKRKYEGRVYLKFLFNADFIPSDLSLCVEPTKNTEISINGNRVCLTDNWRLDRSFRLAELSEFTKQGINEIVLSFDYYQSQKVYDVLFQSVMESLRNCLSLDTEIEAIYLLGSFGVRSGSLFTDGENGSKLNVGPFTLVKQKQTIDISDAVSDLYPFFAGKLHVKKTFIAQEGTYTINVDGRFSICNIYINGEKIKTLVFDRVVNVNLVNVENTIELELINSMRNTWGPLHHKSDESFAVAPSSFSYEGQWSEDKVAADYKERDSFMRFGINDISFNKIK